HEPVRNFLPRRRHRSLERRSRRHLAAAFTRNLPFRHLAQPGAGKTLELHRVDTDHPQDDGQAHVSADAGRTGRRHAAVEPAARIAAESGRGARDVTFARRIRRAPFGALSRVINRNCGFRTAVGVLSLACPRASTQREGHPGWRTQLLALLEFGALAVAPTIVTATANVGPEGRHTPIGGEYCTGITASLAMAGVT